MSHALPSVRPALAAAAPPVLVGNLLGAEERIRVAGFFPGLGSRGFYRSLGRQFFDSGVPTVTVIYREAARALGLPLRPELLLPDPEHLPAGTMERQGFIGASLLVHSLVLDAHLRDRIARIGAPVDFVAYTGESFGVLTAAVASGSLSVFDGVRIAQAFTPLMLRAAGGEPYHVVAVKAQSPGALAELLDGVRRAFPLTDVEVHKTYAPTQANLYVRPGAKPAFDALVASVVGATSWELKEPTVFLAHSARMRPAREALERFIDGHRIHFDSPQVPVVSNHDASLLTTASAVRQGVLAMTDRVMASRDTCESLNGLDADLVVELGLGEKSVRLLRDNGVAAPVTAYTGSRADTTRLLSAVNVMSALTSRLVELYGSAEELTREDYQLLHELFRLAAEDDFCDDYFSRALGRVITAEMARPVRQGSPAFYRFLEVFQRTRSHREHLAVDQGELAVRARLKKWITAEDPALVGQAYLEVTVRDAAGDTCARTLPTTRPEVVVFHFGGPCDLDDQALARRTRTLLDSRPAPDGIDDRLLVDRLLDDRMLAGLDPDGDLDPAGRRIVYQYLLFGALARHRPALFAQSDHYLEGGDVPGWLAALAVSGAVSLADAVTLGTERAGRDVTEPILKSLTIAGIPLLSPAGVPIRSRRELEATTRAVLRHGALETRVRPIRLNGNCQVVALGSQPTATDLDAGPFATHIVAVTEPAEAWRKRVNLPLDEFEYACVLALTGENERVLATARSRRVLSSTVYSYIGMEETVLGFGQGGSESMTVFVRKEGEEHVTVRKVLSEALTTARWDPEGQGVMLPPFAKARRQAEFLQSLPAAVRGYFPEVFSVLEREALVPYHLRFGDRSVAREVIYEMSYLVGEEVSRFVEKHVPPAAVIARLYEQIIRVLNDEVHSTGRVPAPGGTLETSYFRKIEDRLELCRRTAPRTFGPQLLDTDRILVNGVSYLNHAALLARFRGNPEFARILEPAFHSLVVGDTNTENIKITDTGPLHNAQRLIESGAPQEDVDAALAAITPAALGIRFLDPRAIGFRSEGKDTRDDPMYDNKPWHNSIGHYDELHHEQFTMSVDAGEGRTPSIDIAFRSGNPYQRAYRVRDVSVAGGGVGTAAAQGMGDMAGMEDYFAPVMTAALGLDDPESRYLRDDPYWLIRFVFMMGQHFTAMPPFHFQQELDGTLVDSYQTQRRPVAIYCEGVKWLNWALQLLEGDRTEFLGLAVPPLPHPND
ncbi:ACP S-malonyltransferase [Kitasatospora sp. LaBMicrA B282]|uniref:ACP S-malonyltransferase n=1 Tax=Kitasatospora sp. LaBMicrA B282 TaxID=3420949 RepID=UPI003D150B1E